MRPLVRRTLGAVAAVAAVATAFTAGVVAGAGSQPAPQASGGGLLDEAADEIADSALRPVDRAVLDAAAIEGMLEAAGDQWGAWNATDGVLAGEPAGYAGVGVWLRVDDAGAVVVAQVTPGSPAEQGGLRIGDEVRAVAGRTTKGLAAPAVAASLRGRPGSTVSLLLRRGSALRPVVLQRQAATAAGVSTVRESSSAGRVGRIVVPAFGRGTGRAVREALAALRAERAVGVVVDLRGNPGGLLDEAVETASAFLDGGRVVSYTRRGGAPQFLDAVGTGDTSTRVVVLVDGGTASAAEVVAGALQDRGRAVLVGSRTFGKGSVQEPRVLSDGSALELTIAYYATPSGRSLEGTGLEPDIEVAAASAPAVAVGRAVQVLSGLLAAAAPGRG